MESSSPPVLFAHLATSRSLCSTAFCTCNPNAGASGTYVVSTPSDSKASRKKQQRCEERTRGVDLDKHPQIDVYLNIWYELKSWMAQGRALGGPCHSITAQRYLQVEKKQPNITDKACIELQVKRKPQQRVPRVYLTSFINGPCKRPIDFDAQRWLSSWPVSAPWLWPALLSLPLAVSLLQSLPRLASFPGSDFQRAPP